MTLLKTNTLVSIVIPAYNVGRYIEECILSVVNQTYTHIEILVVNDGSSDNTPDVIDKLAIQDKRIVPIHQQNAGVSASRNIGIKASKGEYLIFVDGDDYIAPDFVEYMLKLVKMTGGELCLSLDSFTRTREKQVRHEVVEVLDPIKATALLLSPRIIVGSWNKIYKKSILLDNNLEFSTTLFLWRRSFFSIQHFLNYALKLELETERSIIIGVIIMTLLLQNLILEALLMVIWRLKRFVRT